ncbi:MAG: TfpX/TfpZ family type IV pilin accessory protein [Candidatus Competibacter sp.]|nr:TfpX/TfpZ family type IV pilin accessory protein [Candidatus Competibacter sp.]MDG4584045.1 TfpX/TfpZ family type IV pilin accessory protein [Candidatus Competibacter sp.]
MTKLRAFAIHLTASAIIVLAFLGVMFLAWYPAPYFETDGGWKVLRILAGVDVVLGPLLTLIVFKPGKPGLKFDMSCIVVAQLGALIYGGTIIYQERPAFVVFGVDRFTTVPAADVDFEQLRYPELKRIAGIGPMLAEAKPPKDLQQRQELLFGVVLGGQKDLEFRAELYEPYRPDPQQLRARGIDLSKIAAASADAKQAIDAFVINQGGRLEDYLYLPLKGNNKDIVMALSPKDGMPVGSISISPWLEDY